jgi:hypothetical protein
MSKSDTRKIPIQSPHMKLCLMKLARCPSETNRWNLQDSRGEVWRTLPERGGIKRGTVLLFRPRGYLSTRHLTLRILAPSYNTAAKRSKSPCIHRSTQIGHVPVHNAHWCKVWVSITRVKKHADRLWATFKISKYLTKIHIYIHKHIKLSRDTTHSQAGRPKLGWLGRIENDLK